MMNSLPEKLSWLIDKICRDNEISILILSDQNAPQLEYLLKIINGYYLDTGQPYLFEKPISLQSTEELTRVFIVATNLNNELLGVICICPLAIDLRFICKINHIPLSIDEHQVELRRFVSLRRNARPEIAIVLMAAATRWCRSKGHTGILAITRAAQKRFFSRFGMTSVIDKSLALPDRGNGEYWILQGDWTAIERATDMYIERLSEIA